MNSIFSYSFALCMLSAFSGIAQDPVIKESGMKNDVRQSNVISTPTELKSVANSSDQPANTREQLRQRGKKMDERFNNQKLGQDSEIEKKDFFIERDENIRIESIPAKQDQ